MWCVVGLGNPGPRYRWSRHNVGFLFLERFCQTSGIRLSHRTSQVSWGVGEWCDQRILTAIPRTYMNLSGVAMRVLRREQGCDPGNLIVVHDDLDLGLGRLKFKSRGGDGGHKGIRSIMDALGDDRFLRLRIGIGRPPPGVDATEFVLESFGEDELAVMDVAFDRAVEGLKALIVSGLEEAMRFCHSPSERGVREDGKTIEQKGTSTT
jgi:peptidyl-tRNA hydrolase, PTH1 family